MRAFSTLACLLFSFGSVLAAEQQHLIVCGGAEVYRIDPTAAAGAGEGATKKVWSWRAKDCEGLPEKLKTAFATTDDCKPIDGGTRLLVSASSGGCALLEIPSGKALWWARVPNAHTIESLPGGLIAVASSTGKDGNKLLIFDSKTPETPLAAIELPSAHGLVWDDSRKTLWAMGYEELLACGIEPSVPASLEVKARYPLPDKDGHDLRPVPGGADLILGTDSHVWRFDRDKKEFRPDPDLGDHKLVKCTEPVTPGRLMFIQASEKQWWTDELHFLEPESKLQLKGEMIYKARRIEVREVP
ncbi:DUF6528 family protein [Haloferula sp. BvORR071]|uniref:DUF6528 family protein n=1 Tax=Haloferula sp. BvORR071 TaxID=1396141 RepID=UPI000698952D|nr:DUF6528 family protein [Haloferula sp. BvORR071]